MPFTTSYGPTTTVQESGLWVYDGTRRICLNYKYETQTGILTYAACVYRCETYDTVLDANGGTQTVCVEPDEGQMRSHAETASRRYHLRPVIIQTKTQLEYDEIIPVIRHEMCHGYGVKGPRYLPTVFGYDCDSASDTSSNTFLSDASSDITEYGMEDDIDWDTLVTKPLRKLRYVTTSSVENYKGDKMRIVREFFIAFRAIKKTGQLIYGAAISRRPEWCGNLDDDMADAHYETAIGRLDKKPVVMRVSPDNLEQLKSKAPHREDVMYEILDMIKSRPGGKFLIRG